MLNELESMLLSIVTGICRKSEAIEICFREEERTFFLKVDAGDYGRCVGKKGIVIWAISAVMWYASLAKARKAILVKLIGDNNPSGKNQLPFKADPKWDRRLVVNAVDAILRGAFNTSPGFTLPAFVLEELESGDFKVIIKCDKYLKTPMCDPSFEEAVGLIVHAAGMVHGAIITTEVVWE